LGRAASRLAAIFLGASLAIAACGAKAPTPPAPPATSLSPAAGPNPGIAFLDASHGWALADCGAVDSVVPNTTGCRLIATTDGGKTWTAAATGLPSTARLQFFSATAGFATVSGGMCAHGLCPGYVLATTDGGRTWTARYAGPVEVASIDFSSPAAGWSVVDGGVDQSTDGGVHWHESVAAAQGIGTKCKIAFVRFSSSLGGIAGGTGGSGPCLATTDDGGATWKLAGTKPLQTALAQYAAAFRLDATRWSGGQACAAEDGRMDADRTGWLAVGCDPFHPGALAVLRTSDGGTTWNYVWGVQACPMGCHSDNAGMQPLFFLNGAAVWRVAPHGVERTTDAGTHWSAGQPLCSDPGCQVSLAFVSADLGWASTAYGQAVYMTRNGGQSWTRQWP
jgi:photosystem II stability/assembly factor-like uncharacterized protein